MDDRLAHDRRVPRRVLLVGRRAGAGRPPARPRWAGARIALPAVFVFTALTLVVTLVHLDLFHLDADARRSAPRSSPGRGSRCTSIVPVLMVVAVPRPAAGRLRRRRRRPACPPLVRVTLVALAGAAARARRRAPGGPGAGPTPSGRGRSRRSPAGPSGPGCVGLGVAAAHAGSSTTGRRSGPSPSPVWCSASCRRIALLRYGDELVGGLRTLAFGGVIVVLAAVSAWALWAPAPDPSP